MAVGCIRNLQQVDGLVFFSGNFGDRHDSFHPAYVRQLRCAEDDVADGVDARFLGLHPLVGLDEAAICLDFGLFKPNVFGAGLSTDRNEDLFCFQLLLFTIDRNVTLTPVLVISIFLHLRAGIEIDPALR